MYILSIKNISYFGHVNCAWQLELVSHTTYAISGIRNPDSQPEMYLFISLPKVFQRFVGKVYKSWGSANPFLSHKNWSSKFCFAEQERFLSHEHTENRAYVFVCSNVVLLNSVHDIQQWHLLRPDWLCTTENLAWRPNKPNHVLVTLHYSRLKGPRQYATWMPRNRTISISTTTKTWKDIGMPFARTIKSRRGSAIHPIVQN